MNITITDKYAKVEYGKESYTHALNTISYTIDKDLTGLTLFRNNEPIGTSPISKVNVNNIQLTANNAEELLSSLFVTKSSESDGGGITKEEVEQMLEPYILKNGEEDQGYIRVLSSNNISFESEREENSSSSNILISSHGTSMSSSNDDWLGGTSELSIVPSQIIMSKYDGRSQADVIIKSEDVSIQVDRDTTTFKSNIYPGGLYIKTKDQDDEGEDTSTELTLENKSAHIRVDGFNGNNYIKVTDELVEVVTNGKQDDTPLFKYNGKEVATKESIVLNNQSDFQTSTPQNIIVKAEDFEIMSYDPSNSDRAQNYYSVHGTATHVEIRTQDEHGNGDISINPENILIASRTIENDVLIDIQPDIHGINIETQGDTSKLLYNGNEVVTYKDIQDLFRLPKQFYEPELINTITFEDCQEIIKEYEEVSYFIADNIFFSALDISLHTEQRIILSYVFTHFLPTSLQGYYITVDAHSNGEVTTSVSHTDYVSTAELDNRYKTLTQAEYDALPVKNENTIYFIKE